MICIVGLGVIGGSYAMALKEKGLGPVCGIDVDPRTLEKALSLGLICEGASGGADLIARSDMVILSIYPHLVEGFVAAHRDHFQPGTLLTDATGVKGELIRRVEALLPDGVDFVAGHPMAGREKMGLDFASSRVFQGANYLITPTPRNSPQNLERVEELARALGFGRVTRISPDAHDELIAYTSQLPHAMAVALVNSDVDGRDTGRFIGDSYRDLTRIARINGKLWSELFDENRAALLAAIARFETELDKVKAAVEARDTRALEALFQSATLRRDAMDEG